MDWTLTAGKLTFRVWGDLGLASLRLDILRTALLRASTFSFTPTAYVGLRV